MTGLAWNWLSLPYFVCALAMAASGIAAALVRGDRVLRLGAVGAATTALPWALTSGLVTCTTDPEVATRLLRLGNGPIALVGPSLLLVMLGVSGQLERHRWLASTAGVIGLAMLAACWGTDWVIAGAHELGSGIMYPSPGPLTAFHFSSIGLWLAVGLVIARRSTTGGERRKLIHMLLAVLALGTIGATDLLLVYDIAGSYPIAWLPAGLAAILATYYELKSDLLRPQGIDRGVGVELVAFAVAMVAVAALLLAVGGGATSAIAVAGSIAWTIALGFAWTRPSATPRIASERALDDFVASLADVDTDDKVAERLAALWKPHGIAVRALERVEGELLIEVGAHTVSAFPPTGGYRRPLASDVAEWLVRHNDALAANDLNTMLLGALRPKLERLVNARGATLIVPLIDRGTLVGLVEADHGAALREEQRGVVVESARTAARALTYVALARTAGRERETAREVEVAEAMRQAAASRAEIDELGRWAVTAEYRTAVRTTGAGWSATLLPDGRLAVLVTEAQAHGVAAALATAALTGAFAAATSGPARLELDDLLTSLRASAEGVVRGGEPVAAFVAILDGEARTIAWACAGHPGAALVGPLAERSENSELMALLTPRYTPVAMLGGGGAALGASLVIATRGTTVLPPGALLAIASSGLRRDDDQWSGMLQAFAPAGPRLGTVLVEHALAQGGADEDLLAVIVRERAR